MPTPRRFIPSTAALAAFEAAARLGSFSEAARELALTQSAISKQIRTLEDALSTDLFIRERQTVRLTAIGERYAREIGEALRIISQASLNLRANALGGTLDLAILPTFGTRWLAPRLPVFLAAHPGITINLTTRLKPFDFSAERLDAAIHFGLPDWPGAETAFLMRETVLPVASPAFAGRYDLSDPLSLLDVPRIHLASRPDAWRRWFEKQGVADADPSGGMVLDQFATAAQAAVHGLGIALLPTFLVIREMTEGLLVPAPDRPIESAEAYHLAWPRSRADYPVLKAFRRWLVDEAHREYEAA
jgi:LysR family glycine cleavage system transcriptional activator